MKSDKTCHHAHWTKLFTRSSRSTCKLCHGNCNGKMYPYTNANIQTI